MGIWQTATAEHFRHGSEESLRANARFPAIKLMIEKEPIPCIAIPETSQFDFWLGEWEVFNPQGQLAGVSRIEKIANGCGLLENWTNSLDLSGKSINFYDPYTKKWHQYWIDYEGIPIRFLGVYEDGAMKFMGESFSVDGKRTLTRMTFFNLGADTVRQLGEDSTDEGKTWTVSFDLKYIRKASESQK